MKSQRDITVEQLHRYAKDLGLAITESPDAQRRRSHGSVQGRITERFGAYAIEPHILKQIFSKRRGSTREPNMTELYMLSVALEVPMLALKVDMKQPYMPSPMTLGKLDMLSVVLNETAITAAAGQLDSCQYNIVDPRFSVMSTAVRIWQLEQAVEGTARAAITLRDNGWAHEAAMNRIQELALFGTDFARTKDLYYPRKERDKLTQTVEKAMDAMGLAKPDVPQYVGLCLAMTELEKTAGNTTGM